MEQHLASSGFFVESRSLALIAFRPNNDQAGNIHASSMRFSQMETA